MKEKVRKIFVNSKTKQMSVILPRLKEKSTTITAFNDKFEAVIKLRRKR